MLSIKNSANVYLDAPPISRSIHQLTDYSSYLVYSLCSLPLVTLHPIDNTVQPLAASYWKMSKDYTFFEFFLRDDLYWSNGEKVNTKDYYQAFVFILKDKKNRFRNMLSDIIGYDKFITLESDSLPGITFEDNSICFRLYKPNYLFLMYLSLLIFSPLYHKDKNIFCGAYYIDEINEFCVKLKQNNYFKIDEKLKTINKISFIHQFNEEDPFALNAFNNGIIDVTSDTSFPYDQYIEYAQQHSIIQEHQVGISCTLSENKNTPAELTKLIIHGINRAKIINELYNIPNINCGYHNLYDNGDNDNHDYLYNVDFAHALISKIDNAREITIAYEDYYPNLEILTCIAGQLSRFGLRFKFLVEEYGTRSVNSDYRLELRKSPIPDPLFFYKNALKSKCLSNCKNYKMLLLNLLNKYQQTEDDTKRRTIAVKMDTILIELGQYVPLIKIPGIYLKNPVIKNSSLFIPGQLWYI